MHSSLGEIINWLRSFWETILLRKSIPGIHVNIKAINVGYQVANGHAWSENQCTTHKSRGGRQRELLLLHSLRSPCVCVYLGYVFGWKRKSPRTPCTEDDGEAEPIAQGLACHFLHADEGDLWFAERGLCEATGNIEKGGPNQSGSARMVTPVELTAPTF